MKRPYPSAQAAPTLMIDPDQREDVRVNPERHACGDDRAQREHTEGADGAGEGLRPTGPSSA